MFLRHLQKKIIKLAGDYPVLTLLGPRQSGKTTLVKESFPGKPYVNLEMPETRELADTDPHGLLKKFPSGCIFDEIQNVPKLLSYIQVLVDETQLKGMFILTGSHQLLLHQKISQSLAGRTVLLNLLPMSIQELGDAGFDLNVDEYLYQGFYPRIYKDKLEPTIAYRSYLQTYIERDVRDLIGVKDLVQFQRFMKLCAGRIGQVLNMESIGNEIGLSGHTVKNWLSILEASFVIIRLQPYFENFGKRIIKSPKLYFIDVGIAAYLLGIESVGQAERDPLRGNLFENLVLMELVKARFNQGLEPSFYFFRDSHMNEIDLIFKRGDQLIPIEIKSSATYNQSFLKRLKFFKSLIENRCQEGYLIYSGDAEQQLHNFHLINYKHSSNIMNGGQTRTF